MQFCTFYLSRNLFGVAVLDVQEVIRQHEITIVPLAPHAIRGLINLRGNIVSTIDMRRVLKMEPLESGESINIITKVAGGLVSLLVDQIGDVIEVSAESFEPVPTTLGNEFRHIIARVCTLPQNLLMILNPDRIVEFDPARVPAIEGPGRAGEVRFH